MEIRTLTAREIECRIGMEKENGVSLLLYKDARCDMAILDETFGSLSWKRSHQVIDGRLYCTVEVYDPSIEQWIQKQDVGTESYTEAEKGQASDSFKRACVNFGIGRELYTAPFIWINAKDYAKNSKGKCSDKFEVNDIAYNEYREIERLRIINANSNKVVFSFGYGKKQLADKVVDVTPTSTPAEELTNETVTPFSLDNPKIICEECNKAIYVTTDKNGNNIGLKDYYNQCMKFYGHVYCNDCRMNKKIKK